EKLQLKTTSGTVKNYPNLVHFTTHHKVNGKRVPYSHPMSFYFHVLGAKSCYYVSADKALEMGITSYGSQVGKVGVTMKHPDKITKVDGPWFACKTTHTS